MCHVSAGRSGAPASPRPLGLHGGVRPPDVYAPDVREAELPDVGGRQPRELRSVALPGVDVGAWGGEIL